MLSVCYKVLIIIIKDEIEPFIEQNLSESQCGFRKNRSPSNCLFTILQIMGKCREMDKDVYQLFIDFKQAYDSVKR